MPSIAIEFGGRSARAVQALAHGAVEDVEDQRRFPRPGHPGHRDQQSQRQAHGDVLQVVLARPADGEGFPVRRRGGAPEPGCEARPER